MFKGHSILSILILCILIIDIHYFYAAYPQLPAAQKSQSQWDQIKQKIRVGVDACMVGLCMRAGIIGGKEAHKIFMKIHNGYWEAEKALGLRDTIIHHFVGADIITSTRYKHPFRYLPGKVEIWKEYSGIALQNLASDSVLPTFCAISGAAISSVGILQWYKYRTLDLNFKSQALFLSLFVGLPAASALGLASYVIKKNTLLNLQNPYCLAACLMLIGGSIGSIAEPFVSEQLQKKNLKENNPRN